MKVAELKKSYLKDQVNDFMFNPTEATALALRSAMKNKKHHNNTYNNTLKISKKAGVFGGRGLSHKELLNRIKLSDDVRALGRKALKEKRGISVWDFDDTIARTKSGVLAQIPNPSGKPMPKRKVIFMAGGPGAGKSTATKGLGLEAQGFKIVNQDISLQWLAKNNGLPTDMRQFTPKEASKWSSLSWQARDIAKRKQTKFQGKGDGIIVDGTGANKTSMTAQMNEFKRKGSVSLY